ncbi:MAG: electron transfer flavoprotein subunit beta, partial [Deltaproteobacteria bacterium]|nr:electron transfer flavoprotein subunit beta [Deltaproteobacteria bacterium]
LKGKMRAKSQKIEVYGIKELKADSDRVGLQGSATQVIKVFLPPRLKESEWIEGTVEEQVNQLLDKLNVLKLIV